MKFRKKVSIPLYNGHYLLINLSELVYCKSSGNYTQYHTKDGKKYIGNYSIGATSEKLPTELFYRIRRELLININHIRMYHHDGSLLLSEGTRCKVSARKQKGFKAFLQTKYYVLP